MIKSNQVKTLRKTKWQWFTVFTLTFMLFSCVSAIAWEINLELRGTNPPSNPNFNEMVDAGMFLDMPGSGSHQGFHWNPVAMKIKDDGTADITGVVRRLSDNSQWNMNVALSGHEVRGNFSSNGFHEDVINELIDPNGALNNTYSRSNGFNTDTLAWREATVTFSNPNGGSVPFDSTWFGKHWNNTNYHIAADLRYNKPNNTLEFAAWYYDDDNNPYRAGDSKVNAYVVPGTTPVPEPSTYALLSIGLIGLGIAKRRRNLAEKGKE